ncbi:hypothetical protein TTRE_0000063501 [Trichuris trichiura]|uniref:Uncharacterized protein n=1 Tax=Trichuris trichiura TaxID=36087 RepID=A0A077YX68_TRITR|nr:hypothetical protein TTRE_0000063501 [Trichuris trichiura]
MDPRLHRSRSRPSGDLPLPKTDDGLWSDDEDVVFIGENVRWSEFAVAGQRNNGSARTRNKQKKFPNIISKICHSNEPNAGLWRGDLKIGPLLPLSVMLQPAFGNASKVAELLSTELINCPNATPRECFVEYMEKCMSSDIMDVVVTRVVPNGNDTVRYGIRYEMIKGWRFLHCAITDKMPLVAQIVIFPLGAHEELPALLSRLGGPGLPSWQDGIYLFLSILKSHEYALLPTENCEDMKRYEHQQFLRVIATPPSKHIREYYNEMMKHQKQLMTLELESTSAQSSTFHSNKSSLTRTQRETRTVSPEYKLPRRDDYFEWTDYSAHKQMCSTPKVQRSWTGLFDIQ